MESGCDSAPEHECIWADGRARAWYCDKHYEPWKKKADKGEDGTGGWLELVKERKVKGGAVGKKYGEDPNPKAARVALRKQGEMTTAASIALMKWLSRLTQRLGVAKHVYVVGGAVRNFLIDKPIKDIDMVVDSIATGGRKDSEWLAQQVARSIPTRTEVVTDALMVAKVFIKGPWDLDGHEMQDEVIEIVNARAETYAEGEGHKPVGVEPTTLEEDVLRREFTFNTLMWRLLDLADGPDKAEIIDLTGCGRRDLERMEMRCPQDPDKTFADDPTRIIRTIKFAFKYGFKLPPDVKAAARRQAKGLKRIPSKVWTVLRDIALESPQYKKALTVMDDLGVIDVLKEMVQEDRSFASTLLNYTRDRGVAFMFDLMDLGVPVGAQVSFLPPAEQRRFREITVSMDRDEAQAFLDALKNPGVAYRDKRFIPSLAMEHGFKGKEMPQFMGRVTPMARALILEDPSLSDDPNRLKDLVRNEVAQAGISRTASALLNEWGPTLFGEPVVVSRIATPEKYKHIDFKPPESVANAAKKGQEYRQKASPSNRGGLTPSEASAQGIGSGVQRAVNLKNRDTISPQVIKQMKGFLSRSEKSSKISPEHKGEPWNDKGYVAWLLWGGDPAKAWVDKIIRQMDAADEKAKAKKASENEPTNQKLWDKVVRLTKGEVKSITHDGKTVEGPNDGNGFDIYPSAYANGWAAKAYKDLGGGWKKESSAWGPTLEEVRKARGKAKKDVGHGGLDEWFSGHGGAEGKGEDARWGDWVAISPVSKTLPSGKKVERGDIVGPCGISDDPDWKDITKGGKDPLKCMPRQKAHDMPKKERAEKAEAKMKAEKKDKGGKKPTRTPTFSDNKKALLQAWGAPLASEQIPGGLAKGRSPSDFDAKELEMGIEVEKEHLVNDSYSKEDLRATAQEIAMDHLAEIPDYYTRLKKMESEAEGKKASVITAAWGDTIEEATRVVVKKARTYKRLVMFDFDGTLFRSWEATPEWWKGTHLDTGPYSFFVKPESLDEPCVPDNPPSNYWIQKPLSEAKQAVRDRNTVTVLITGRVKVHKERVKELLAQKGLRFNHYYFNPGMSAARFKVVVLKNLLVGYNTIDAVEVWENENMKTYDSALRATAGAVERDVSVEVHHIHVPPKELVCGPEDFDLPSMNTPQRLPREAPRLAFTEGEQRFESPEEWGTRLAAPKYFHVAFFDSRGRPVDQSVMHLRSKALVHTYESLSMAKEYALSRLKSFKRAEIRVTPNVKAGPGEGRLVWEQERPETPLERFDREMRERSKKTAAVTGDGTGVGFFIPIPEALADQFPSLEPHDDSPPHITFMYVGGVLKDQQEQFLAVAKEAFSQLEGPVKAVLDGVDTFQGQEQRVAYSKVRFSQDLIQAHDHVKKHLEDNGFEVAHSFPFLTPHATLAYLGPTQVWEGHAPEGTWTFDSIQVWGLPDLEEIPLGEQEVNLPDDPELGARRFARLHQKRDTAARLRAAWGNVPD
jgi:tRNA nucleotidyltransferase/poly(A) polymerase/2'-5' RNA ligase